MLQLDFTVAVMLYCGSLKKSKSEALETKVALLLLQCCYIAVLLLSVVVLPSMHDVQSGVRWTVSMCLMDREDDR